MPIGCTTSGSPAKSVAENPSGNRIAGGVASGASGARAAGAGWSALLTGATMPTKTKSKQQASEWENHLANREPIMNSFLTSNGRMVCG